MNRIKGIFKKDKNIIIGAVHFPPLLGYPAFPGMAMASQNALRDLQAFSRGRADGVIFENNYDLPHTMEASSGTAVSMAYLGAELVHAARIPVGVNVLWNDFKTSFVLAKTLDLSFIRVPVFVDTVKTDCGVIKGNAREIVAFRKKLKAEQVALFTDIHVKHSKLLSRFSLVESARRAIRAGSDGLIITGKWTSDAPDIEELARVRAAVGKFPILIGSGVDSANVKNLFQYANGAIVSTSLKSGGKQRNETNIKSYKQRIDVRKVRKLLSTAM